MTPEQERATYAAMTDEQRRQTWRDVADECWRRNASNPQPSVPVKSLAYQGRPPALGRYDRR